MWIEVSIVVQFSLELLSTAKIVPVKTADSNQDIVWKDRLLLIFSDIVFNALSATIKIKFTSREFIKIWTHITDTIKLEMEIMVRYA